MTPLAHKGIGLQMLHNTLTTNGSKIAFKPPIEVFGMHACDDRIFFLRKYKYVNIC